MQSYSFTCTSNDQVIQLPEKVDRVTDVVLSSIQAYKSQRTIERDLNDTLYISEGETIVASPTRMVGSKTLHNNQILLRTPTGTEHVITFPPTLNRVVLTTTSYPTVTFESPHGLATYPNVRKPVFAGHYDNQSPAASMPTYTVVDDTTITLTSPDPNLYGGSSIDVFLHCPKMHVSEIIETFRRAFGIFGVDNEIVFRKRRFFITGEGHLFSNLFNISRVTLPCQSGLINDRQVRIPPGTYSASSFASSLEQAVNFAYFPTSGTNYITIISQGLSLIHI